MIQKLTSLIVLLLCNVHLQAENNLMFEKANQLYRNGDYELASEQYQMLIDDGYCHSMLFYNAGNAYFRTAKIGRAISAYRTALSRKSHTAIEENLEIARQKVKEPIKSYPELQLIQLWRRFCSLLSLSGWSVLALMMFMTAMAIQSILLFRKALPTVFLKIRLFAFSLSLFFIGCMSYSYYHQYIHYPIVIIDTKTPFESKSNTDRQWLHDGIEAIFLQHTAKGDLIRLPNGDQGYIAKDTYIKVIP